MTPIHFTKRLAVTLVVLAVAIAHRATAQQSATDSLSLLAERSATHWVALVDSGHYKASWDSAAAQFRSAVSPADWNAAISAARAQVGAVSQRKLLGSEYARELPGAPPGQYVVLQYSAVGRDQTRLVETITVTAESSGAWRVVGYYIRPE